MNPTNSTNSTNSTNPMNSTNPKVAILGAGGWGKNLVRVFCTLLGNENVTVVDLDPVRRGAAESKHPGVGTATKPTWPSYDAVIIAAPAALHYELAAEALGNGIHVLVEKPIALSSNHARKLIELAEHRDRVLMVDHLLEYHPAVVRLKALVDEGRLGRVLHLTSRRLNLGVIRTEENALWSLAPHDISVILYLLDQDPVSISARGAAYLQPGIPDVAHVTMTFDDGAIAFVHASWLDPVRTRCLTVAGDQAMAVYDDTAETRLVLHHKQAVQEDGRFVPKRGEDEAVEIDAAEPLRSMAEVFLASIETGRSPRSDGWDGWRVVRVLEAAQASMDKGGIPIRMERKK